MKTSLRGNAIRPKEESMSEITREQVERALAEVRKHAPRDDHDIGVAQAMLRIFGNGWLSVCPRYVAEPFDILGTRQDAFRAALERWLSTFPPVDHKAELEQMARPRPAEDPAPTHEVVDVPQPVVKRCKGVEVWWNVGDEMAIVEQDDDQLRVPVALMEAMVDAIRATRYWDAIKAHHARWDAQLDAPTPGETP